MLRNNTREVAKGKPSAQTRNVLWNRKWTSLSGALYLSMASKLYLDPTPLAWAAASKVAVLGTHAQSEWGMANLAASTTPHTNLSPPMGSISGRWIHILGCFKVPHMKVPKLKSPDLPHWSLIVALLCCKTSRRDGVLPQFLKYVLTVRIRLVLMHRRSWARVPRTWRVCLWMFSRLLIRPL